MNLLTLCIIQTSVCFVYGRELRYSTKYDHVDFEEVLRNGRLLLTYVHCLLDQGPCSPEGRFLQDILPEAVATSCKRCSNVQKSLVRMSSRVLKEKFPEYWEKLSNKYDPERKYLRAFNAFLDSQD